MVEISANFVRRVAEIGYQRLEAIEHSLNVETKRTKYARGVENGTILVVIVVPRAKRTTFVGWHDGFPRFSLAAPPVDGKANEELLKILSTLLDVPSRSLEIAKGPASKRKSIFIRGMTPDQVRAKLEGPE